MSQNVKNVFWGGDTANLLIWLKIFRVDNKYDNEIFGGEISRYKILSLQISKWLTQAGRHSNK